MKYYEGKDVRILAFVLLFVSGVVSADNKNKITVIPDDVNMFYNYAEIYIDENISSITGFTELWWTEYNSVYERVISGFFYDLYVSNQLAAEKYKGKRINIEGRLSRIYTLDDKIAATIGHYVDRDNGLVVAVFNKPDERMMKMSSGDKVKFRCTVVSHDDKNNLLVMNNCSFTEDHVKEVYNNLLYSIKNDIKRNDGQIRYYSGAEMVFIYNQYKEKINKACKNKSEECYKVLYDISVERRKPGFEKGTLSSKLMSFYESDRNNYKEIIPTIK
ncbi:hypothetical protein B4923_16140 [Brenneria roseae subsp. americana]|uniref:tRNA_anti-like n=1 Tax=Brenneria roseae subsp. americana TaxID=1508507 RepID=A0A2U1TMK5_9GAMM|nr:hypothetical protein [Brenneria roseae]PWC10650.1 hypothetical protein B4923_16140 [Brenneria roseae subsp. americana]